MPALRLSYPTVRSTEAAQRQNLRNQSALRDQQSRKGFCPCGIPAHRHGRHTLSMIRLVEPPRDADPTAIVPKQFP